jgi:hypothetical protein
MTHKRNVEGLKHSAQLRHQETVKRTEAGISQLLQNGRPVNFRSVAQAAGVSTAWLYQDPVVRQRIEHLREQHSTRVCTAHKGKTANASREAILETLRGRVKKLEAENQELRQQLEVVYGQLYKKL